MKLQNKTILIVSPEPWDHIFVSKHHYAINLAKRKNRIYFLNPPTVINRIKIDKLDFKNVFIINYGILFRGRNRLPAFLNNIINRIEISRIKSSIGNSLDIVWSFDPYRYQNLKLWKVPITLYHSVDFHNNTKLEKRILKSADIVVSIANLLIEHLQNIHKREYYKINHGLYLDNQEAYLNIDFSKTTISYFGNFHGDIDYDLLIVLIKSYPNFEFLLFGPKLRSYEINNFFDSIENLKNVHYFGKISHSKILSILKYVDVNLIIFKEKKSSTHCNPHKVLTFLYAGNTTISTFIDEYTNSNLIEMGVGHQHYLARFNEIVTNLSFFNSDKKREERRQFALNNTYDKQINRIETLIEINAR